VKREEAVKLLSTCKPLAEKLTEQGFEASITSDDWLALAGFYEVLNHSWLKDSTIYQEAGLDFEDITRLRFIAGK
jgi:hypothetical protein